MVTLKQTLRQSHDWAIDRMTLLCDKEDVEQVENAFSIEREFHEWLGTGIDDHEIYSLKYLHGELEDLDD